MYMFSPDSDEDDAEAAFSRIKQQFIRKAKAGFARGGLDEEECLPTDSAISRFLRRNGNDLDTAVNEFVEREIERDNESSGSESSTLATPIKAARPKTFKKAFTDSEEDGSSSDTSSDGILAISKPFKSLEEQQVSDFVNFTGGRSSRSQAKDYLGKAPSMEAAVERFNNDHMNGKRTRSRGKTTSSKALKRSVSHRTPSVVTRRDSRLASNFSARASGGWLATSQSSKSKSTLSLSRSSSNGRGGAKGRLAAAASALGVFSVLTDDYGLAMVQAITNKLNKNKTTLLCGLPVGYDIDSVYDCLGSFVKNKNTLIGAADEPDLEQYLLTIIPENVPGKRKGKKAIVKVLVQSWGGIRQLEFSHLSSSTQPASSRSTRSI